MYTPQDTFICPYEHYYSKQAGSGINVIYKGALHQRGHGIGSFLGGLFRSVLPLLTSGAKVIGKEALNSGIGLLSDVVASRPIKESIKNRLKEASSNLKRKADAKIDKLMTGSGINKRRKYGNELIRVSPLKVKAALKKTRNKNINISKDIFSN